MKKFFSLLLCLAMLGMLVVFAGAYDGENYVQFSDTAVAFPKNQHICGDSNGDGTVNMLDVMSSLRYLAGTTTSSLRDSIDTNYDGSVSIADALLIIRHVLGEDVGLGELVE